MSQKLYKDNPPQPIQILMTRTTLQSLNYQLSTQQHITSIYLLTTLYIKITRSLIYVKEPLNNLRDH